MEINIQGTHFKQIDSTNDEARRRVLAGAPRMPFLISATRQSAGRGRSGRAWQSPPGGAWFTVAWPMRSEPDRYAAAPLVVGLGLRQTLRAELGADRCQAHTLEIKWPNDLLLDGRKVAGILCEAGVPVVPPARSPDTSPGGNWLFVGVGVNLNIDPRQLGADLRYPAASVHAVTGHTVAVAAFVTACTARLATALTDLESDGFTEFMRSQIMTNLAWRNETVELRHGETRIVGKLLGLDSTGRLQLDCAGQMRSFDVGEVFGLQRAPSTI